MALCLFLFVRYRNHFPVVQVQNQAHIRNPHGTDQVCKKLWGAVGAPIYFSFTAAEGGAYPNGRRGRRSPEGEAIPAEGGCFTSLIK